MSASGRGRHVRDPRHPVARLALQVIATAVVAVLVVVATAGAVLVRQLDDNIEAAEVESFLGENRPTPPPAAEDALTVLVLGADRADSETADADSSGSAAPQGRRADTTLLLHLSADRSRASVVSIPRDSMVQAPSCRLQDGSTSPAGLIQINSAFATGGASCAIATVEATTGVFIDHYVVVDYEGFTSIVNALGGVRVCLTEPVQDSFSGLDLDAGEQVVRGEQALAYVRARKIGDGSDLSRINRQQAFLSSMVQQATSTGLLARPDRLIAFLDAGTKSLTTDPGLASVTSLASIGRSVQSLPPEDVSFLTIPNEPWSQDPNRVVWTDDADLVWDALAADQPLPGQDEPSDEVSGEPTDEPSPTETEEPLTATPDELVVDVINAGAQGGAATEAATDLRIQGFEVDQVLNGDNLVQGVRILVPTGQAEQARTLAAAFADAEVVRGADVETITVQLGEGAGPVQEVPNRLGTEPLPERSDQPGPSSEPSFDVRAADDDICA